MAIAHVVTNGDPDDAVNIIAAEFKEATGDAYDATPREFDYETGSFWAGLRALWAPRLRAQIGGRY